MPASHDIVSGTECGTPLASAGAAKSGSIVATARHTLSRPRIDARPDATNSASACSKAPKAYRASRHIAARVNSATPISTRNSIVGAGLYSTFRRF